MPKPCRIRSKERSTNNDERLPERLTNNEHLLSSLTAEPPALISSPPQKELEEENRFLKDLVLTFAEFNSKQSDLELTNWGGWWRNRFREDPDKARRVLAEVRSIDPRKTRPPQRRRRRQRPLGALQVNPVKNTQQPTTNAQPLDVRCSMFDVGCSMFPLNYMQTIPPPSYPHAPGSKGTQTSRAAADRVRQCSTKRHLEIVVFLGQRCAASDEIGTALGLHPLKIRPRLSQLRALGVIEPSGTYGTSCFGNRALRWHLAPGPLRPDLDPALREAVFRARAASGLPPQPQLNL
jgi:hypothetical protein